jgi:hypothetical protein
VGRAGLEPATYGLKEPNSPDDVQPGSPECHETSMIVELDDARGSTSTSLATVAAWPRHDDPRHVAVMLREELARLDEGDAEGVRAVMSAIAELLA